MKPAERLLPGTDALKRSTVEATRYHGKILVRYRRPDGYAEQQTFSKPEDAHRFFRQCTEDLARRIRARPSPDGKGAKP